MKQLEKDTGNIRMQERECRMKCFLNLVSLEIREHDTYRMPEAYEIQDDMHFSTPEGSETLIPVYRKAYHDDLLHKIAVGVSRGGKSLLRRNNQPSHNSLSPQCPRCRRSRSSQAQLSTKIKRHRLRRIFAIMTGMAQCSRWSVRCLGLTG